MAKFRVYVSGELDYDYEIEAANAQEAEDEAQWQFENDFPIMWSGINTHEVEELEENES